MVAVEPPLLPRPLARPALWPTTFPLVELTRPPAEAASSITLLALVDAPEPLMLLGALLLPILSAKIELKSVAVPVAVARPAPPANCVALLNATVTLIRVSVPVFWIPAPVGALLVAIVVL